MIDGPALEIWKIARSPDRKFEFAFHGQPPEARRLLEMDGAPYLRKPYVTNRLRSYLREVPVPFLMQAQPQATAALDTSSIGYARRCVIDYIDKSRKYRVQSIHFLFSK